jgi:tetrapyrrole methylase family protein/MazG family protein
VYIPPVGQEGSFESFQNLIAHLRAPNGCPWDREQTHLTLRSHLIEEAYETLDAIDSQKPEALREELGDLLLQIVLHAQIAFENQDFSMLDVLQGIQRKLIYRHPHVFGDEAVEGSGTVLRNWEKLKESERAANGQSASKGLLDGVPNAMPALSQAQKFQERAARVGFDWDEVSGVLDKLVEEIGEFQSAAGVEDRQIEMGDILFSLVNLARWYDIDAESALRATNLKFKRRFSYVETKAKENGQNLSDMSLPEMDAYWDESKHAEG